MKSTYTQKKINLPTNPKKSLIEYYTKNLLVLFFFTIVSSSIAYGQNSCKATLVVEDNGNVDSASPEGVMYKMIITNNGLTSDTYSLFSMNVNSNHKNPDESTTNTNVVLPTVFLDSNKNQITKINVEPGESVHFLAKLSVPTGTVLARWSTNQIIATSKNCNSYKVNTILHTYVLNPNND